VSCKDKKNKIPLKRRFDIVEKYPKSHKKEANDKP
jgi:hypothetical protein